MRSQTKDQRRVGRNHVPNAELLDLLWGAERPSVLVALGHYDDTEPPADDPRIDLGNGRQLNYAGLVDWLDTDDACAGDPRTLLLLMACSSVATEIAEFGSILGAATSVGAAAVVGTEIPVATNLVSRFTREVTTALWNDPQMTLGRAVLDFRRRLVAHGIPLGEAATKSRAACLRRRHGSEPTLRPAGRRTHAQRARSLRWRRGLGGASVQRCDRRWSDPFGELAKPAGEGGRLRCVVDRCAAFPN